MVTAKTITPRPPITPAFVAPITAGLGSTVSASARLDRTAVLQGRDGRVRMELVLTAKEMENCLDPWTECSGEALKNRC